MNFYLGKDANGTKTTELICDLYLQRGVCLDSLVNWKTHNFTPFEDQGFRLTSFSLSFWLSDPVASYFPPSYYQVTASKLTLS